MKNLQNILFAFLCIAVFTQCDKQEDISLPGTLPDSPNFTIEPFEDNPNKFWVTDLSEGNFTRVWDFGEEGTPKTSILKRDSVFFSKKGDYPIKLHVSATDGSGTATGEQTVTVTVDGVPDCDGTFAMLTDDCTFGCWKFSSQDAALLVGPNPLSGEWFSAGALEDTQYDDTWCFDAENFVIDYENNGGTFSACQGYVDDTAYPIPAEILWEYTPGGGVDGTDRIEFINADFFFGSEDSGPVYDIFEITPTTMTIVSPLKPCDGAPSEGFFTYYFIKE